MTTRRPLLSVPPPRRLTWALAWLCWVGYAVLDFGPQIRDIIRVYPWSEWWGFDGDLILQAGHRLMDGQWIYADKRFMYTPAAAVFGFVAALVPRDYALVAYALFKLALAIGVTYWVTRRPWLSVLGVVTCLPFINDIAPGNFMVPLTAAMAIATFGQERRRSGIFLGVVAAAIPKPFLVPYFLWLLLYRRKAAEGAIAAGVAATLVAAVVTGPWSYVDWFRSLANGSSYIGTWSGNYGVSNYLPTLAVPIAIAVMALTLVVLARAEENRALAWVLAAGILVSPYAGPLEALPLMLALPLLRPWPRVYALTLIQPLSTISVAACGFVALIAGPLAIETAAVKPARVATIARGRPGSSGAAAGAGSGSAPAPESAT